MNAITPHAFASPATLAALRNDIASRRKARQVNFGIILGRHGAALCALARRHADRPALLAAERLVAADARREMWTPATSRDLRAVVRGLSAAVARATGPVADTLAWRLDRLRELSAQDARIAALEAVLEAHWPDGLKAMRQRAVAAGKRR